ncbi:MAG: hypothetical protein ACOCZX_04880 [Candidatus Bipolaricaulota bacterium]
MYKDVHQSVKVGVRFTDDTVEPVWFFWKGRKYEVDQVNFYHRTFRGEAPLHYFSVSVSGRFYKLAFDGKKLRWELEKLWNEESYRR